MNVKIYLGESNCTHCGKKHKKIFEIDGKPYGESCARDIIGKELSAPLWLYKLAEEFLKKEVNKNIDYSYLGDISCNFISEYATDTIDAKGCSKVWRKPIKIQGKSIKSEWQSEINKYIGHRYPELICKQIEEFSDSEFYTYKPE